LARAAARLLVLDLSAADGCAASESGEQKLVDELRKLGFELESSQWTPPGHSADETALRSVLLAHKPKIVRVLPAALPRRADAQQDTAAVFGASKQ
jgi:hypothetical protein